MSLLKENFQPREYQKNVAETALKKNTLCILPTGMGKTYVAILVTVNRLEKYPESKILMLAPTRPLANQHRETFMKFLDIPSELLITLTGRINPNERMKMYDKVKLIFATPQTIANDINTGKLNLSNFSCLVVDECHRSVKRYPYPFISKKYMLQSKYPIILGLTASPGATQEKIQEICNNLFIKNVEVRSEVDADVEKYVPPVMRENVYVELPEEFKKIKNLLEEVQKDDLYWLREHHYTFTYKPTRKMLLDVQRKVIASYMQGSRNYGAFWAIMRVAGAIKIEHAIELLETQGIKFLHDFLKKVEKSKKKTDSRLVKDPRFREAIKVMEELYSKGVEHPKLEKVVNVVKDLLKEKPDAKIIVFANYRTTVDIINELLNKESIKSAMLIGQTLKEGKGLTQQQQIETLNKLNDGSLNVIASSSIGEEGLSLIDLNAVIFFDQVATEIRLIQRRGRTGRTAPGKVIFLITKDTRDEAYYFASLKKEKKMKGMLYCMKEKGVKKSKTTLLDWA